MLTNADGSIKVNEAGLPVRGDLINMELYCLHFMVDGITILSTKGLCFILD